MLKLVPCALLLVLAAAGIACTPPAPEPAPEAAVPPAELVAAAASILPQFLQDRREQGYGDDIEIVRPSTEVLRSNATDAAARLTFFTRRPGKADGVEWAIEVPLHKNDAGWSATKYTIQRKTAVPRIEE